MIIFFLFHCRDLRFNPVKCDCKFYHRWNKLRTKGIALQGKCSISPEQDGPDFKDLTNDYFKCGKYPLCDEKL